LNREITLFAVGHRMAELRGAYTDQPDVLAYLDAFEHDVIDNVEDFRRGEDGGSGEGASLGSQRPSLRRYQVNVLVDHSDADGAPVVYEDNPSYQNLVGRVEHLSQLGTLITDFTLIKPGALHHANGGYLLLDAHKVLLQPYAWEGLKRALFSRQIRIESLAQLFSLVSTVSLEPDPIPLRLKVVLVGERLLYYLLCHYDPDFPKLFKVAADFNERIERNDESNQLYARLLGTLAREHQLKPLDRSAVARVIDHSARLAGDAERLSVHIGGIADLLQEADYCAADVQQAIDGQIRRVDRMRERLYEEIQRGTILVDTDGERIGQVNGLSVIDLGNFAFGQPSRITATARLGEGDLVDIEREVELGGAIHSKGVLILSNFLASRYAPNRPLSLSASVVFEQSYGMVEGDSASLAELCALLSALAQLPIRQSLAVTGSVNQHGQVQPIGGVNEKIEGFFDVCRARGLTGQQGVLIPAANAKHLMLRDDVVEAANAGQFHVYPVDTVDQALELLTGVPAGAPDAQGAYPEGSANQRVDARLEELLQLRLAFAERAREYSAPAKADDASEGRASGEAGDA
jgi:predicted ATP-dependent protease